MVTNMSENLKEEEKHLHKVPLAGFHTGFFSFWRGEEFRKEGGGGGPHVCLTTPTFVETTPI